MIIRRVKKNGPIANGNNADKSSKSLSNGTGGSKDTNGATRSPDSGMGSDSSDRASTSKRFPLPVDDQEASSGRKCDTETTAPNSQDASSIDGELIF